MSENIVEKICVSLCTYFTDILFREIVIINESAIPKQGPMMLYGNHNNQFIDGMLMKRSCPRPINFITAASSLKKPVLGPLMTAAGAIPLERAMDLAKPGKGTIIKIENNTLYGEGTKFSEVQKGGTLDLGSTLGEVRIQKFISDTEVVVSKLPQGNYSLPLKYKTIPKMDYNQVYASVWKKLSENGCVGIFPEGGSHDRLEMLPLKAGICIFALGAMQKYGIQVTLVSCGFNYFNPQMYRSKVIMQFGVPYTIPIEMVQLYKTNRKEAISALLKQVQQRLLMVTTHSKNFNNLSTIFMIRELYMLGAKQNYTDKEKVQINRRFLKGFQDLQLSQNPEVTKVLEDVGRLDAFVRNNGLKVSSTLEQNPVVYDLIIFLFYFVKSINRLVFTLPGLILLYPSIEYIAWASERERIKCLKASKVKIQGNDVVGSTKLRLSLVVLPITSLVISLIAFLLTIKFTRWQKSTCVLFSVIVFVLFPFYLKQMMPSLDTLGHTWKKLKYLFLRLFKRDSCKAFNRLRISLSQRIREIVKQKAQKVFPNFNDIRIVTQKDLDDSQKLMKDKMEELATPRIHPKKTK